jgi:uracil-DNA glycosylase
MELAVQANLALDSPATRLAGWQPECWPIHPDWRGTVDGFLSGSAGQQLGHSIRQRLLAGATVYPPQPLLALALTPLASVRVVILGQDPYHGPGQAQGLAFSVPAVQRVPPSLRNIFKELQRDLAMPLPGSGNLQAWAQRGILLLNTCLTVEQGQPASHAKLGWQALTDAVVAAVAAQPNPCVYLLWGGHAQAKASLIEAATAASGQPALVLKANHPSPLSVSRPPAPFAGCGHFSQAQQWLARQGVALTFLLRE